MTDELFAALEEAERYGDLDTMLRCADAIIARPSAVVLPRTEPEPPPEPLPGEPIVVRGEMMHRMHLTAKDQKGI